MCSTPFRAFSLRSSPLLSSSTSSPSSHSPFSVCADPDIRWRLEQSPTCEASLLWLRSNPVTRSQLEKSWKAYDKKIISSAAIGIGIVGLIFAQAYFAYNKVRTASDSLDSDEVDLIQKELDEEARQQKKTK